MEFVTRKGVRSATSPDGYRITWAENGHGTWFNCWSPAGKQFHSGYDKGEAIAACDAHKAAGQGELL
jgi:hypothetical protein